MLDSVDVIVKRNTDFTDQLTDIMMSVGGGGGGLITPAHGSSAPSIPTGVDCTKVRYARKDNYETFFEAPLIPKDVRSVSKVCGTLGYDTLKRLLQDANGDMRQDAVVQYSLLVKDGQCVLGLDDCKMGTGQFSFEKLLARTDLRGNSLVFSVAFVDEVVVSDAEEAKMQKWFG